MLMSPVTSLSKGKTVKENHTSVFDLIFLIFFFFFPARSIRIICKMLYLESENLFYGFLLTTRSTGWKKIAEQRAP